MSDGLQQKLGAWVEKSGRALELRTVRLFRRDGRARFVRQSVPYDDPGTGKQREGDVLAMYHWASADNSVMVQVAVECKSGKSEPWVAFYDDLRFVSDEVSDWWAPLGKWDPEYVRSESAAEEMADALSRFTRRQRLTVGHQPHCCPGVPAHAPAPPCRAAPGR